MTRDPHIDEGKFGRAYGPMCLSGRPGRDALDEEHRRQQLQVADKGRSGNTGLAGQRGWDEEAAGAASKQAQELEQIAAALDVGKFRDIALDQRRQVGIKECGSAPGSAAYRFREAADDNSFQIVAAVQRR